MRYFCEDEVDEENTEEEEEEDPLVQFETKDLPDILLHAYDRVKEKEGSTRTDFKIISLCNPRPESSRNCSNSRT